MSEPVVKTRPPLAREVVRAVAVEHGVCVKPLPLRRIDLDTGRAEIKYIPCGNTLASVCPTCAERNRKIRAVQCRQGWHMEEEPRIERADPEEEQRLWVQLRAEAQQKRDEADQDGGDLELWDGVLEALDEELERLGARGKLKTGEQPERRTRSTRRRQDAPDLPRRPVEKRTVGKLYTAPDGKTFRPSLFLTLTLDSYGRVRSDGTRSTRPPTTTRGRLGTPCTSPSSWTASSRTSAGSSAMTSSTSRSSNHSDAWRPTSTWPSAAPSPAPRSAK